jgi:chemotaxis protein methyltransferase CheR
VTIPLPADRLQLVCDFVAERLGLDFAGRRLGDLNRAIVSAAREMGFDSATSCIDWLLNSPLSTAHVETLASHLTVGETYFFRDPKVFEFLEREVLPTLLRERAGTERKVRVWSAGCCTGEEPYSIAMAAARAAHGGSFPPVSILATDINPRFLAKAREAVYGEWSFRDTPESNRDGFFRKAGDRRYRLNESIRQMVSFGYLNLAEDTYPSLLNGTNAMDVIFCRNVLMYFETGRASRVIEKLRNCLVDGGILVVSAAEASHVLFQEFERVDYDGVAAYRKGPKAPRRPKPDKVEWHGDPISWLPVPSPVLPPAAPDFGDVRTPSSDLLPVTTDLGPPTSDLDVPSLGEVREMAGRGRYDEACQCLERMAADTPPKPEVLELLARVCANMGRLDDALEWCDKAIAAERADPRLYFLRSTILHEKGAIDEAAAGLKKALYLDQDFVIAYFALGNVAFGKGNMAEAKRHFRVAGMLLNRHKPGDVIPESDGVTAGRLKQIVEMMLEGGTTA